jgi:glutathione S-transferase
LLPLIESAAILDHLDELAGPERALIPREGSARRHALKICALATGLADKAVILVYERVLHEQSSPVWVERCRAQIQGVLEALEADRRSRPDASWWGERIGHADIAVACALRLLREAHPECFNAARWPELARHCARCEALEAFQSVTQPFLPPAR